MSVVWTNGENFILCPYGTKDHFISESRFSTHVVKCKKSSNINLATCPYNSDHRLQVSEYQHHVIVCEDRILVDMRTFGYDDENSTNLYPIEEKKLSHQVESWDNDDDPSYNPEKYCISKEIVRRLDVEPGSIRKGFRNDERARFQKLARSNETKFLTENKENDDPSEDSASGWSEASSTASTKKKSCRTVKGNSNGLVKSDRNANRYPGSNCSNVWLNSNTTNNGSTILTQVDSNESENGSVSDYSCETNFPPLGCVRKTKGRGRFPRGVDNGKAQVKGGRGRGHL